MLWSLRGVPLGAPVADDWSFLHHLRFGQHELWDSFGAVYYWRPVSRQLGMRFEALWMESHPILGAAIHLGLLLAIATLIYRLARRALPAPSALCVALTPMVTEAHRVLITWPSGSQHLLAMLFVALAVHESFARRLWTTAIALALALGSHENAVFALPALLVDGGKGVRSTRSARGRRLALLGVSAVWLMGYSMARSHGVQMPVSTGSLEAAIGNLPSLARHLLEALLGLEDLPAGAAAALIAAHVGIALLALAAGLRRGAPPVRAAFVTCLALGLVSALPLALLLPDWNAWRASVPLLAIGVGVTGILAGMDTRLAQVFVLLRLIALLLAPTPTGETLVVPSTRSDFSFVRLGRLQRIVHATRAELLTTHPTLPRGARIRYWTLPSLAEVGFQQQKAAQVWYRDTTISFGGFGGAAGFRDAPDVVLGYDGSHAEDPAVVVTPHALALYQQGFAAAERGDARAVDSLVICTLAAQPVEIGIFTAQLLFARATARIAMGDDPLADSLLAETRARLPDHAGAHALAAGIALRRGARDQARQLAERALELDPNEPVARQVLADLATPPPNP